MRGGPAPASRLPCPPLHRWLGVCLNSAAQLGCTKCRECKQAATPHPAFIFRTEQKMEWAPQIDLLVPPEVIVSRHPLLPSWVDVSVPNLMRSLCPGLNGPLDSPQLLTHDGSKPPSLGAGKKSDWV